MKNKISAALLCLIISASVHPAFSAQKETAKKQQFIVYYVDMQRIINESLKGKQAKSLIEAKIQNAKKKIDEMRKEIDKIKKELQNPVISKQEKEKKEDLLQQKIRDLQRFQQDTQLEVMRLERKYTSELIKEVVKLIQEYQKKEKIPMIVDVREAGIIAADPKYDLTDKIIKLYNQQAEK